MKIDTISPTQLYGPENNINITKTSNNLLVNNSYDELGASFLDNVLAQEPPIAASLCA